jgi:DNA sulfur modification protein DndB
MLSNLYPIEDLSSLSRAKARDYETKTVSPSSVQDLAGEGWKVDRSNKKSVRLQRPKSHGALLEDRVWTLLHSMRFPILSGEGGAQLALDSKSPDTPKSQLDVVAVDDEVAVAIECKSAENPSKRPQFQQELGKLTLARDRFTTSVRAQYPSSTKRPIILAMFLWNVLLSENDRARAREANVLLFNNHDLTYYESLVSHIGPASKYQLLAEMLPGKSIPGLAIRIPAVKTKMGGISCYTFSISPEYLLKISYVSHRSKGQASDVATYQRMLNKSRLNNIREYITDDGIFPTNIVINFEKNRLRFERIHQESSGDTDSGVCGWLDIRPTYKSAWIIDGQHRLYAYSGHARSHGARLSVLAFDGLDPSEQARLFIDINAKQKSVQRSLLQELYAELHWNSEKPTVQIGAIISRAIQQMNGSPESPLFGRIQTADSGKNDIRCVSLTSLYGTLEKTDFFVGKEKNGQIVQFGPLWAGDNESTLRRTKFILNEWLTTIRIAASEWWDKGAGEGGGLAMNDGLIAVLNVLRSVFQHLNYQGLVKLDNDDLWEVVKKYAVALGEYLGSLSEQDRKAFRDLRGGQGQITRTRNCQAAIRRKIPDFNPPGLDQFIEQEKQQINLRAKEIIDDIERKLQKLIVDELRRECGADESGWWMVGVPKTVRLKVSERFEEEGGQRGGKEHYFDLVDYEKITLQNWPLFEPVLAYDKSGSKEKRLSWLHFVNEKRKIVSHPSAAVSLTPEDLSRLEDYQSWFNRQIMGSVAEEVVDEPVSK